MTGNHNSTLISVWHKLIMPLGVSVMCCSDCDKVFSYYAIENSRLCSDCGNLFVPHHSK
jgi:predicted amidophosphoribosyltransferase